MAADLPSIVDVRHLLAQADGIAGTIAAHRLSRIGPPYRALEPVHMRLRIDGNATPGPRLTGHLETVVAAACQRCLDDMRIPVARDIDVVLVEVAAGNDADADAEADIVTISDYRLDCVALAEDEIILACPMVPLHDDERCHAAAPATPMTEREQPFAGLADLLAGGKPERKG